MTTAEEYSEAIGAAARAAALCRAHGEPELAALFERAGNGLLLCWAAEVIQHPARLVELIARLRGGE